MERTINIFYVIVVFELLLAAVLIALFTFLSSLIGEGLSRKAFPKHLKFWDMFTIKNMGSRQFLNRVIIAYVFVVLMMMYETIFYGTVGHLPGWWNPASMVTDPNIQTNWFAWLQHFGNALNAGFFEEFEFRAIPISLGVLIGSRFNKRKLGITIAFIFKVLMFSAAHANYRGFPAYARLLELLVVAFSFGVVFYYFGIIPGIITHFIYDLLNMATPIMTTPGNILAYQKVLVVIILLSPLILALYGRTRNKAWLDVTQSTYNEADQGINLIF